MVQNRCLSNLKFFYFKNGRFGFKTAYFKPPFIFIPIFSEIRKCNLGEVLAYNDFVLVLMFGADGSWFKRESRGGKDGLGQSIERLGEWERLIVQL